MVVETAVVPKQTPRTPGADDWAAERIAYERRRRGWSTAELARRVTAAGCKINQSSVWHIENGQPRRKVSTGEAVAFAEVFGISLDELMRPPDDPEKLAADIARLDSDLQQWEFDGRDLRDRLKGLARRYEALSDQLESHPLKAAISEMIQELKVPEGWVFRTMANPDEDAD
jgi:transcriptional regulator with XRE-family HTH domain